MQNQIELLFKNTYDSKANHVMLFKRLLTIVFMFLKAKKKWKNKWKLLQYNIMWIICSSNHLTKKENFNLYGCFQICSCRRSLENKSTFFTFHHHVFMSYRYSFMKEKKSSTTNHLTHLPVEKSVENKSPADWLMIWYAFLYVIC